MLKRFFSIFTISLILTGSFFSIYSFEYPVYADSTNDEWMNVTTNEQLVEAFRYYCKSRDLTIEGSVADGVTSFTTQTFNSLCNTLGIDVTALQAHLKYASDSNSGLRFLFDSTGITAYNQIFSQFLQDNELEVGDVVEDETLYDGQMYGDSLLFITNRGSYQTNLSGDYSPSMVLQKGSVFLYDTPIITSWFDMTNAIGQTFYKNITLPDGDLRQMYTKTQVGAVDSTEFTISSGSTSGKRGYYYRYNYNLYASNVLVYDTYNNAYYFGILTTYSNDTNYYFYQLHKITSGTDQVQKNVNVYITTNNTTINNNSYEGDTIINNNGDTNIYPDNPDNPYPDPNPNPSPDPPTIPDSGGWQDFSLPEMPNDWLIYGMEKKFPFDIPFNIMFALSLLNHEPEIPKFEGDIDLKVCTWHYDIDLTPFDDLATILRKFEVLAFIIGLAILTKNLINWG